MPPKTQLKNQNLHRAHRLTRAFTHSHVILTIEISIFMKKLIIKTLFNLQKIKDYVPSYKNNWYNAHDIFFWFGSNTLPLKISILLPLTIVTLTQIVTLFLPLRNCEYLGTVLASRPQLVRASLSQSRALWVWYHADALVQYYNLEPLRYHSKIFTLQI